MVRSPITVGTLRTLEERGLIKRGSDPSDARKTVFRLTKKGIELEALARQCALDVERAATRSLSAAQSILSVIRKDLDDDLRSVAEIKVLIATNSYI